jgi:hypothetical protein
MVMCHVLVQLLVTSPASNKLRDWIFNLLILISRSETQ